MSDILCVREVVDATLQLTEIGLQLLDGLAHVGRVARDDLGRFVDHALQAFELNVHLLGEIGGLDLVVRREVLHVLDLLLQRLALVLGHERATRQREEGHSDHELLQHAALPLFRGEVDAAIFRPAALIGARRFELAFRDEPHRRRVGTDALQAITHGLRAAIGQGEVVLFSAARIRMTREHDRSGSFIFFTHSASRSIPEVASVDSTFSLKSK